MLDIQFVRTPFATVTKAYRGNNGEMYVEGVASSTGIDQTKERMSPDAIKIMAAGFTGKPLNSEHHNDWDDQLGKIIQSDVIDRGGQPALWIKAKLNDWLTRSKDLFNGLNNGNLTGIGLSVEGKINPGGLVKEFDPTTGQYIPTYKDISPAAVAITNKPANLDTFVDAVTKSIKVDELPEAKSESYVVVRKVVDGVTNDETVCKDPLCEHQKCMNKACKNFCEKCGVAMGKDVDLGENKEGTALKDDNTLDCGHSGCPHGQCTGEGCFNMCKVCTAAKAVDMAYAGPVPASGLARQDMATVGEGKKKEETDTQKATVPAANTTKPATPNKGEAIGEQNADNSDLANPPAGQYCTHDYCEHGNCMEGACPNSCSVCSTRQPLLEGENKIDGAPASNTAIVGKDVTNAHQTKPSKYKDVPQERFLDPANHKYPADAKHLPAALAYFNHNGQRSAGGYSSSQWASMGSKLAGFLGGGYHYDASSEKVVQSDSSEDAKKSTVEGGEYSMHNNGVNQKSPYNQEVLDIIKYWGQNNPGNYDLFAKANASAVSQTTPQAQVQSQQTVQKGSSSSDGSNPFGSGSSDSGSSKSSDSSGSDSSGSSSSDSSDSGSSDSSSGSTSTSSGESLSSLLSSVLTTLSDMKSSVSGGSSSSSSDSSDSSTGSSDKTSTDKNFGGSDSMSSKTGTDKNFGDSSMSTKTGTDKAISLDSPTDATGAGSSDSYDEATKALSLALANFQVALLKAKKQPQNGVFPESGTQHAKAPGEGVDDVNGPAQEPDESKEPHRKEPMPKAPAPKGDDVNGPAQEPDFNSLAGSDATSTGSVSRSTANQEKLVKSIDKMVELMTALGTKVEAVEGKVEALPNVRKGIAINKQFTEEEQAELAKSEAARKKVEADLIADPRSDFKTVHQYRTYGEVPAWYAQPK